MKRMISVTLSLLFACEAKSPSDDDSSVSATAASTAQARPDRSGCGTLYTESIQILKDAVSAAPVACSLDSDCVLYVGLPECVYPCGLVAAVSDQTSIDAAVDRVNAELCPANCGTIPPSCGGGYTPFDRPRAICKDNACTLDTHLTVIREAFQTTLYPLLRSTCQGCHSSETQKQEPLLADPDIAQALENTMGYFLWIGEGDHFSISDPATSRLVQMLSIQQHQCWSDCSVNASELTSAISAWSDAQDRL